MFIFEELRVNANYDLLRLSRFTGKDLVVAFLTGERTGDIIPSLFCKFMP